MNKAELVRRLAKHIEEGRPLACATIVATEGSVPRETGAKMLVFGDGAIEGTIGGGPLEAMTIDYSLKALSERKTLKKTIELTPKKTAMYCEGKVEILIEVFVQDLKIVILGGGHIGEKLSGLCGTLGIAHVVVDDRKEFAVREKFPKAMKVILGKPDASLKDLHIDEKSFIVIVTRCHSLDISCLASAMKTKACYIGMIGSRSKVGEFFSMLHKKGLYPEKDERVHAPVGLDTGGKAPGDIALSILAEINKIRNGTSGLHLRDTVSFKRKKVLAKT
ncbi:XdhC family protein [Elusimicrobiota bacterium]